MTTEDFIKANPDKYKKLKLGESKPFEFGLASYPRDVVQRLLKKHKNAELRKLLMEISEAGSGF